MNITAQSWQIKKNTHKKTELDIATFKTKDPGDDEK